MSLFCNSCYFRAWGFSNEQDRQKSLSSPGTCILVGRELAVPFDWSRQLKRAVVVVWNYTGAGQLESLPFQPNFEFHGDPLMLFLKPANGPWESIEILLTRVTVREEYAL